MFTVVCSLETISFVHFVVCPCIFISSVLFSCMLYVVKIIFLCCVLSVYTRIIFVAQYLYSGWLVSDCMVLCIYVWYLIRFYGWFAIFSI